jgi:hypothetical protein
MSPLVQFGLFVSPSYDTPASLGFFDPVVAGSEAQDVRDCLPRFS